MTGEAEGVRRVDGQLAWTETYEALVATQRPPVDVEDVERLAEAAYFIGRDDESASAWEQAHQIWLRLGNPDRAARCVFWLGIGLLLRGELARANGWFGRGARIVAAIDGDCAGRGYLLVPTAMMNLEGGDAPAAAALYAEVGEIAERCGDADLLALSLLGRGEAAIVLSDTRGGLALLDEVMVAATTGELSPMTTGIMYCAVIDACVRVFDLRRAAEWTEALTRWCDGQRDLVPYRGQCLVHRSQVLQAHGEWPEALAEADRAGQRLSTPPHPAVGVAFYQQGELHRLRGEFAEAEKAYRTAGRHGREPSPGMALLRLAEGKVTPAAATVRRMAEESRDEPSRLAVLPAYVEVMLAAEDVDAARRGCDELAAIARRNESALVHAMADHATASVLLAEGRVAEALDTARRACHAWRRLEMPYEAARSQVVVALACRRLGDGDGADVELDAAAAAFDRLGARPDADRVAALRSAADAATTAPPGRTLTARECDVLRLVAAGKTNRDIGAALTISEHTVARHVQNIFTKLGLSSRAAATAYAYEHGLI